MAEELVSGRREGLLLQPWQQPGPSVASPQPWEQLWKPWEGPLSPPQADWMQKRSGQGVGAAGLLGSLPAAGSTPSASSRNPGQAPLW